MEKCDKCGCLRDMRVHEYAGTMKNAFGELKPILTTMFYCTVCGEFVGGSTRRTDLKPVKAATSTACNYWWVCGWQRKWQKESFATSLTIDYTRDRMWKAEDRYQRVQNFGKYATQN